MSKKKKMRKPRPSIPKWGWYILDGCWDCKNRNGCSGCKVLKQIRAEQVKKIRKAEDKRLLQHYKF